MKYNEYDYGKEFYLLYYNHETYLGSVYMEQINEGLLECMKDYYREWRITRGNEGLLEGWGITITKRWDDAGQGGIFHHKANYTLQCSVTMFRITRVHEGLLEGIKDY